MLVCCLCWYRACDSGVDNPTVGGGLFVGEVTPIPHNRDPEYCLLSEERNPFRKKNTTHFGALNVLGSPAPVWSAGVVSTPLPCDVLIPP